MTKSLVLSTPFGGLDFGISSKADPNNSTAYTFRQNVSRHSTFCEKRAYQRAMVIVAQHTLRTASLNNKCTHSGHAHARSTPALVFVLLRREGGCCKSWFGNWTSISLCLAVVLFRITVSFYVLCVCSNATDITCCYCLKAARCAYATRILHRIEEAALLFAVHT